MISTRCRSQLFHSNIPSSTLSTLVLTDTGIWALAGHDIIRVGECVAGALDYNRMSVAVQYTACDKHTVEKIGDKKLMVALAGSWLTVGGGKIYF